MYEKYYQTIAQGEIIKMHVLSFISDLYKN